MALPAYRARLAGAVRPRRLDVFAQSLDRQRLPRGRGAAPPIPGAGAGDPGGPPAALDPPDRARGHGDPHHRRRLHGHVPDPGVRPGSLVPRPTSRIGTRAEVLPRRRPGGPHQDISARPCPERAGREPGTDSALALEPPRASLSRPGDEVPDGGALSAVEIAISRLRSSRRPCDDTSRARRASRRSAPPPRPPEARRRLPGSGRHPGPGESAANRGRSCRASGP